eukprot:COSAG03_NODE_28147_length_224_cov_17.992000_1_plen_70_part_10
MVRNLLPGHGGGGEEAAAAPAMLDPLRPDANLQGPIQQWLKGTYKGNNAAVRDTHSWLAPFCLPPRPTVS